MLSLDDSALLRDGALIDGQWQCADSAASIEVRNPATGEILARLPSISEAQTHAAVAAAARAFESWRARTADDRAAILRTWCALVLSHQEDLARIMTAEQGKPLEEARGEIGYAASYIGWYAEEARRAYGEIIPSPWTDRELLVKRVPVGVCAAITPWNFPAAMIARKVAPALAAGCTMVVKPATQTPLTALALAELACRAGVPAGVLNVVVGRSSEIGRALTGSPLVRKLSFTGSTEVGRVLAAQCAPSLKRMSLELGGNAPFIVFDDADLDAAVAGAMAAKYRNSGQTCVCANRFLVQDGVYDRFAVKLAEAVSRLQVGNGAVEGTQQGPLIDIAALTKVEELVQDAMADGATLLAGGHRHALGGTFYEPTVLVGAQTSMRVVREEIFGPVAPLVRFGTDEEAIRMANNSEFGLAAYLFSRDLARVWRTADALEVGIVGVNTGLVSTAVAPFGGVKQSGMGREGSRVGLDEYLELKYVCLGGLH
jgi:succinate-semialdehyde dehydrogenase/glutarate-semialdehyde dehydrogenase